MTETLARPTRRTLVRGAAWSVPVVSLAAMAPAFAASGGTSSLAGASADKWSDGPIKHVSWDLTLTNGPVAIQSISILYTYVQNGGGAFNFTAFEVYGYLPRDNSWVFAPIPSGGAASVVASHGTIAANSTTRIHSDVLGTDNSSGNVSATATIQYVGSTSTVQVSVGPVGWGSGSQHSHPA